MSYRNAIQYYYNYDDYHHSKLHILLSSHHTSGTLLASGSDDLHVAIWDWQERKMVACFDSGHRSNVFQVCTQIMTPDFWEPSSVKFGIKIV